MSENAPSVVKLLQFFDCRQRLAMSEQLALEIVPRSVVRPIEKMVFFLNGSLCADARVNLDILWSEEQGTSLIAGCDSLLRDFAGAFEKFLCVQKGNFCLAATEEQVIEHGTKDELRVVVSAGNGAFRFIRTTLAS